MHVACLLLLLRLPLYAAQARNQMQPYYSQLKELRRQLGCTDGDFEFLEPIPRAVPVLTNSVQVRTRVG